MSALCCSDSIWRIPINELRLEAERMCAKFHINILNTERLARVCTGRRTWLNHHADHLYIYLEMSLTFISESSGYKNDKYSKK